MNSEKQLFANQQNSQLSTGPKTTKGKAITASNAIKHGIFTKDLILTSTHSNEGKEEYLEMLNNLVGCFMPQNQMESLLVEKITIDFWRLKRVIRFEAGSIGKSLETIFNEFYSYKNKTNHEIDIEIREKKEYIGWVTSYIELLKNEEVNFDKPKWEKEGIKSDTIEDFHLLVKAIDGLTSEEKEQLLYGNSSFSKLKTILAQNGYSTKKEISVKLIEVYVLQKRRLKNEIEKLRQKQLANAEADKLNSMAATVPQEDDTDKILKYERALQKSIFQNLFLLKKLQGVF